MLGTLELFSHESVLRNASIHKSALAFAETHLHGSYLHIKQRSLHGALPEVAAPLEMCLLLLTQRRHALDYS